MRIQGPLSPLNLSPLSVQWPLCVRVVIRDEEPPNHVNSFNVSGPSTVHKSITSIGAPNGTGSYVLSLLRNTSDTFHCQYACHWSPRKCHNQM